MAEPTAGWRGSNATQIAGFNLAVLLDAIRQVPDGLSRVELSTATGLAQQTVSNIVKRALESELLAEGERRQHQGPGKPRTMLRINPDGAFAVGVHLDPRAVTYCVVDLTGAPVCTASRPLDLTLDPQVVLKEIAVTIQSLLDGAPVPRDRVLGVGLAVPGSVDLAGGRVVAPPYLPLWREVPAVDWLSRALDLPVILDKDVTAAVAGEHWSGAGMQRRDLAFLYLGTGVGVGIVAAGDVVRGTTGNVGEIGHLTVASPGTACGCGASGCLGTELNPAVLVTAAVAAGALPGPRPTAHASPAELEDALAELVARHQRGEPAAVGALERVADLLGVALRTIVNLVDGEAVALGGPTWEVLAPAVAPLLPERAATFLARGSIAPLEVFGTALGGDVVAIGAAGLVFHDAFAPRAATIARTRNG